jgi:ribosomal protein S18 acetylase RimI-like enzyme
MRDWTSAAIERLGAEGATVCVLEESRRLVGAAVVLPPDTGGRTWVTDWYVHPLARGYGFGETLLDAATERAAETGALEVGIGVPASARAARTLLRKRGWKPLHETESAPEPRLMSDSREAVTVWVRLVTSPAPSAEREAEHAQV